MPQPSFPIDQRPCLPARTDGPPRLYSLAELLLDAHRITDLALPLAPATSALLRMLAVMAARITGLDNPDLSLADWNTHRGRLLREGRGFAPAAVHRYLARCHLDLFDPHLPLLQDPRLATQCPHPSGINTLILGRPAGNNLVWLSPHTDTDPRPVPVPTALWHLLIQHAYGPAGQCTPRTLGATVIGRASAGPLRSTLSFHPHGTTLFETLLLHQSPYRGTGQSVPDRCPWEEAALPDPAAVPPPVTWPGRLLAGRSRHAVLLVPDQDGTTVTDAYLTWATQHPRYPATDPYLIIHTDPAKPAHRRDTPRRADAARAVWRDLDALLLADDESGTVRRPAVFDTLNDLPDPARRRTTGRRPRPGRQRSLAAHPERTR
ncbi:type I-E CRISPR-associated protein Cse1/CasA, partial [Streptomyces violascens]|uniref:type I-E CRISPR-associated protein Cse1/CasA n=1 Tax=Streptomyces violascens TaxID=67381 RepID=UPI0036A8AB46